MSPRIQEILSFLDEQRTILWQTVDGIPAESHDGLALETVPFPHPRLGNMNACQWILFIGAHEGTHTAQILEIAEAFAQRMPQ